MQLPSFTKRVVWVGAARAELRALPADVQRAFGLALWDAQCGRDIPHAKRMRGSRLRKVLEVRLEHDRQAYRLMILTQFADVVCVLCAFRKQSTHGIGTPARLLHLVQQRQLAALANFRGESR